MITDSCMVGTSRIWMDIFGKRSGWILLGYRKNKLLTLPTMAQINPHINFNGNAEEAFHFYRSVFGGEFSKITRFREIASAEYPVAEKEVNKIMHIALPIGNNLLMANDVPEIM